MLQIARFRALADQVAGSLLPADAVGDPAALARRRAVSLGYLALGVAPFAALPALLAFGPAPSAATLAAFALLIVPLVAALDLSRSDRLGRAHVSVAAAFSTLVALVASGSSASPALALVALPVVDAALSGSRRLVAATAAAAAAPLAGFSVLSAAGFGAPPADAALAAVGGVAAMVYGLAIMCRALAIADWMKRDGAADRRFEQFAGSLDELVTRHAPSGAVIFASQAADALIGAPSRRLLDQGLFSRVHIADRPLFLQTLAAAAASELPLRAELRVRRESANAFVWVEMRARAVRLHEADPASAAAAPVVAMFRDLGAVKAHQEALIAAREEAERASLAKTRFLAHMSHELRTPLNAIIGFSEILSDKTLCSLTPERRADYADLIRRSGAHLLEVVNSILDMAKIESGSFSIAPRPCALEPLARHCLNLMALKAEAAGVALAIEAAGDLPEIEADPRAVTQMLLNLVGNGVKFTPRGGAVTVGLTTRRGGLALTVRDTGVGIAPEHIGRLGEAFYQADAGYGRQYEGAGLGLSVVRGLVALHGGEMSIESAIGRGATVTVFLPAVCVGGEPRPPQVAPRVEASECSTERVLRRA
ncbi:sensor histidine kinase [Hansschlegelia zhihuaiae]|uniref:histidine kinase n=1 Tax=Hansschlegelia zhihuaiae TaxID=405005 RepID=A0A4V1KJ44_9HYPH|nr:ATP-binding protein [Hansschlegelia zhihuaiae]RXF72902.1 PAS domain-containing sensor histidine kinase [Hansschlegelia zhihuaiae]